MNFYEIEKAEELKHEILQEQGLCCYVCKKPFTLETYPQLAHKIPKSKWALKKYGKDVIHHKFNLRGVCSLKCNSAVIIDPHSLPGQKLLSVIISDLESK